MTTWLRSGADAVYLEGEVAPLRNPDPLPPLGVPVCDVGSIVRGVNSAFPADIVGLQVTGHGPDVRVVTVTGEVDTVTAPQLAAVLTAQLAVARLVVVNLDGVQFLGSAGLQALFEANELATQQDRHLRLVCNSPTANLTLDSAGLREHFTFADNVPDALDDRS
ncbi:MAG: anti-sigma factor antagonist [Pseudonocardiales bacterium]|nr:anti-sigma factor antagonist [Pseudonocardiales bacterium]